MIIWVYEVQKLSHYLQLIWLFLGVISSTVGRSPERMTRFRCQAPESIPNGSYRLRKLNSIMRIICQPGFVLQGPMHVDCVNGKWYGEKPVCAKRGCRINSTNPEHGLLQMDTDFRMILFCMDNYKLAGNRFAYCNGTNWDREIGNCREPTYDVEHECDFETDDYCGWAWEETIGTEWKRVMASNIYLSYRTGPRHDHTTMTSDGGHYMLMETVMPLAQPALLLSPVYQRELSLKTACCFQFYYFMYGAGVGDLMAYIRPISIPIKDISSKDGYRRFHKSGNQNNLWNEAHFNIGELNEDFQIVFVATAGRNRLSDIAIDDVKLMTGEDCRALDRPSDIDDLSASEEVTEEVLFDTQSCRGRCLEASGSGIVRRFGQLYGRCNCHSVCGEDESCCPDYRILCLSAIFDQTTQADEYSSSNKAEDAFNADTTNVKVVITTTIPTTTSTVVTTSTTPLTTTTRTTTTTTAKSTTPTTTKTPTPSSFKPTKTTPSTTTTIKPKRKAITIPTTRPTTIITSTPNQRFVWKTTPKTTTSTITTTKKTTQTSTTERRITPITTTFRATSARHMPSEQVNRVKISKPGKHKIITWDIDNSSKELKPAANKVLLIALILLIITIIFSTAYYQYKEDVKSWYASQDRSETAAFGDVEATSIGAMFCTKANQIIRKNSTMGRMPRLGVASPRGNEDMNCLIDTDNDCDNDASLSIENPIANSEAKGSKGSLSTNL